jgi:hypothetical protein
LFFDVDATGDSMISLDTIKLRSIGRNIPLIEEPEIAFVDYQDRLRVVIPVRYTIKGM